MINGYSQTDLTFRLYTCAVNLVNKYDHEFPREYFENFLQYLDIDEEKFWEISNRYRNKKIWSYDSKSSSWNLNIKVVNN